tara:strand:- start:82 stop:201 length:120 start_codon:yes stop_codon:yes gene_type:complete
MNSIAIAIYFNFIPIAIIAFIGLIFIEYVKYEHRRKDNQ